MVNRQSSIVNSQWSSQVSGQLSVVSGQCQLSVVSGQWSVVSCEKILTIDYRLLTNTILDLAKTHTHQSSVISHQ